MDKTITNAAPGDLIDGKYRLDGIIGSGGMGTVHEATQVAVGHKVAIKLLNIEYSTDAEIVERFQQEARVAGSIAHDNICEVMDLGTTDQGAPYLVMPLLVGESFAKMLRKTPAPTTMQVVDIACQTLSALEAAHGAKIVHRDLKPDNIFITRIGDREDFVKLLDFGISKVLEQEEVSDLTRSGVVLGTAYYLAPEQARGLKKIDHRVDLYAMGVILYEALAGRRPFDGETFNDVMFKIVAEPYTALSTHNPTVSAALEQVILKAMSIDPAERYKDARAMRMALEEAATETAAGARPPVEDTAAVRLAGPGPGRGKWLITAAITAAVLIVAVLLLLNREASDPGPASAGAQPPRAAPPPPGDTGVVGEPVPPTSVPAMEGPDVQPAEPPVAAPKKERKRVGKKAPKAEKTGGPEEVLDGRFGTRFFFDTP